MTMEFDSGFSASVGSEPVGEDAEIAYALRFKDEQFGGLFVDRGGATLAWHGAGINFADIEQHALIDIPSRLGISPPRRTPAEPASLPWAAAWLVSQGGDAAQL